MALKLLYIICTIDIFLLALLLPITAQRVINLGGNSFIIGILTSICCLIQFVLNPVIGSISDTRGRKPLLLVCLTGILLTNLALPSDSLAIFFISRILNAFFVQTQVLIKALIADYVPQDEQIHVFAKMGALGALSFVIGPVISGYLVSQDYGFYYLGGICTVSIFASILATNNLPNVARKTKSKQQQEQNIFVEGIGAFKRLANIDWNVFGDLFRLRVLAECVYSIFFTTFGPVFLMNFNTSPLELGMIISFHSVAMIVANLLIPRIKSRCNDDLKTCSYLGLISLSVSFAFVLLLDTYSMFVLFMVPLAICRTLLDNVWLETLLQRTNESNKGTVLGGFESTIQIAGFLCPTLNALLIDAFTYKISIGICTILPLVAVQIVNKFNDVRKND